MNEEMKSRKMHKYTAKINGNPKSTPPNCMVTFRRLGFRAKCLHSTRGWAWWRIGRDDAFRLESRGFESRSSRHVGTLGKPFTYMQLPVALRCVNSGTVSIAVVG